MKAIVRNGMCRRCYTRVFGIKLGRRDFKCDFYPEICPVCKESHHLVADLKWHVRLRLLFKRTPNIEIETKCEGAVIGEEQTACAE